MSIHTTMGVLILAAISQGCVHTRETLYNPGASFAPVPASAVQVFWMQPPFQIEPIAEMQIRPCSRCSDDHIADSIKSRAAHLGANVVIIMDEHSRVVGGYVVGNAVA